MLREARTLLMAQTARYEVKEELRFMGARLRKIRLKLKLTQEKLAQLIAGDRNSVSRYEAGISKPPQAFMVLMFLLEKDPDLLATICTLKIRA